MRSHRPARRLSTIRSALLSCSVALTALAMIGCSPKKYFSPDARDTVLAFDVALEADRLPPDPSTGVKPHVTLLQGAIRGSELHDFTAAVGMVMAETDLSQVTIKTTGVSGSELAVDPSENLRRLHDRVVDAFRMFAIPSDMVGAFVVTPLGSPESSFSKETNYVPYSAGVNFRPHLVGTASPFKPTGVGLYQLDRAGTPLRTLWTWSGDEGAK